MRFPALLPVVALATFGSVAMHADTFNFSFGTSGDLITGSAVLTGTLTSPGEYTITNIQGTTTYPGHTDLSIAGVLTAGSFEGNDNLLFASSTGYVFGSNGLAYQLSDATDVNVYTDTSLGGGELFQTSDNTIGSEYVPYTVTATTPEPASVVLFGTGLLSVYGVVRRRLQA